MLLALVLLVATGCGQQPSEVVPSEEVAAAAEFRQQLEQAVAKEDWEQADRLVVRELTRYPQDPDLLLLAAQIAIGGRQWEAADQRFEAFAETASRVPDQVVQEWMRVKCSAGDVMQAIDHLQSLPNKSRALHRLQGRLLMLVGDLEGAGDQYEILLQSGDIRPNEVLSLAGSLGLEASRGQFDPNSPILVAAFENRPDDLRPRLAIAVDHWIRADETEAIAELEKIVRRHPGYEPAVGLLAFIYADTAQFEQLEELIADQGIGTVQHPLYWYGLGCGFREAGRTEEAIGCFVESLRRGGDERLAASQLAAMLGRTDQQQMARKAATQASRLQDLRLACRTFLANQKKQSSALGVAEVLLELGRTAEAKAWVRLSAALQQDPAENAERVIAKVASAEAPGWPPMEAMLAKIRRRFPPPSQESFALLDASSPDDGPPEASPGQATDQPLLASQILASPVRFCDESAERDLVFQYDHGDAEGKLGRWLHHTTGGGVAVADFDANGWDDVFFTQGGGHPRRRDEVTAADRLFLNHSGRFTRGDEALANVPTTGYGQGVAAGDINDDGLADLFVANIGPNRLWVNNGDGTFRDVTEQAGLMGNRWTSSVAIADLNGDGHSDLVEVNYCRTDPALEAPCRDQQGRLTACVPGEFRGEFDRLWISQGDGTFLEKTDWADVQQVGRGLGILIANLDEQPGSEVFVTNDMSSNHLWKRVESGAWQESAAVRGVAFGSDGRPQACMGIAYGNPDHDRDFDLLVTNFSQEHNAYYVQRPGGIFVDRVHHSGLAEPSFPMLGFGAVTEDFNCDGVQDQFVANGLVNRNSDPQGEPFAQPAQIFRWTGRRWIEQLEESSGDDPDDASGQPGYMDRDHVGRAVARGDFDRDTLSDLVVTHLGEPASLLMGRSEPTGQFVGFRLVATRGSRDAVGAQVWVRTNRRVRLLQRVAGHGYYATHSPVLTAGLAAGEMIEQVEVRWPSGHRQPFPSLSPGRVWILVEGESAPEGYSAVESADHE